VLRKAGSFRGNGSFRGWLYNVARNVALDELRKPGRRGIDELDEETMNERLADHRSAEQEAAGQQKASRVLQALASLPVAVQDVIWLGRFEFDNYEDLGQALNCSAGTARVRMHRAMAMLDTTYTSMNGAPVDA
jgi:RNA polymerase sigma-70 factor (ECF subfamily)